MESVMGTQNNAAVASLITHPRAAVWRAEEAPAEAQLLVL